VLKLFVLPWITDLAGDYRNCANPSPTSHQLAQQEGPKFVWDCVWENGAIRCYFVHVSRLTDSILSGA